PVIRACMHHLNGRIIIGGKKSEKGVRVKLADIFGIYRGVSYLMTRFGGTWDENFGANVITQTEQDVWEGVILARPECTPFRNKGWLPYRAIEKLDPAKPKGDNSFRPRIGIVGNDAVLSAPTGASSASIAGPSVPPPSNTPPYVDSGRLSPDWDLHELEQNGTQPNDNSQPPTDS
ncbi:hypothetical protein R3P38DRAFT_3629231, partial [Favolaschia claudopus]